MSTLEATLTSPVQRTSVDAIERQSQSQSQSFTLVQTLARVMLTLALMIGMSALFASQIHATFR